VEGFQWGTDPRKGVHSLRRFHGLSSSSPFGALSVALAPGRTTNGKGLEGPYRNAGIENFRRMDYLYTFFTSHAPKFR